jgi:hypothetical protein
MREFEDGNDAILECNLEYCFDHVDEIGFIIRRRMNRDIPIANRVCSYKQMKRAWDIHEDKIRNLKSRIDQ